MSLSPSDWDAEAYHQVSSPQVGWGVKVLDRLPLEGGETVLDAGCGSGRLSEKLLERLPRGRIIAVDSSRNMLREARTTLGRFGDRVTFVEADLAALDLDRVADAVFSAATFHWVLDHDRLFGGLFRALRPGGRLVAQCGGAANLRDTLQRVSALMREPPFALHFEGWRNHWNFAGPEETLGRLTKAGFEEPRAWLEEAPTPFPDGAAYRRFVRSVVLRGHLDRLPGEPLRSRFLDAVEEEAALARPPFTLDYVRLNLEARRPS